MSKYNPDKIDYNKDGEVDSGDDIFAVKDYDGDGKVSEKEETKYRQKRDETKTEYKYNAKGELVESKVSGSGVEVPEPGLSLSAYTDAFLKDKPDVKRALNLARKYNWTQEQFNNYIETKTEWGKSTTDAQANFDLQIAGSKQEELLNPETGSIAVRQRLIENMLSETGVSIPADEVARFARESVRSGLDENAIRSWVASKFAMTPQAPTLGGGVETTTPGGGVVTGTAANIGDSLRALARSYGLPITDDFLQEKIREGLKQGAGWQEWVEGQRNIFRNQAKTLYPTAASQLDEFSLDEILTPYLNAASNMLGIPKAQMKLDDPMWNSALNGDGSPMSLDQWMVKLRTDAKYGWDKTIAARQQFAQLGDELLSAFGMA